MPVWYRADEIYCGITAPESEGWKQDEDTLDTWFSSGLWTFSTLGWPNIDSADLKRYHPTDVLETGYDILPFWVMRMILMTGYALGDIPFRTVYLHGTVRDGKGRKMSKSLGNGMDPIDVAQKFGTDAGRMALIIGTAPGTDSKIDENKIKGYRNFANKIWNITRFVLSNTSADPVEVKPQQDLVESDKKLRDELDAIIKDITGDLDKFRFHLASEKIYHYIWHNFADIILEESKEIFKGMDEQSSPSHKASDERSKNSRQVLLQSILKNTMKVLHPFMPFVTEEVWSMLPEPNSSTKKLLIAEKWPT